MLKLNCSPCHFPGGKVHDEYPFDDYKTAFRLKNQLNTRIKDENDQGIVRRWIETGARQK
jgi:hypothetical protein